MAFPQAPTIYHRIMVTTTIPSLVLCCD